MLAPNVGVSWVSRHAPLSTTADGCLDQDKTRRMKTNQLQLTVRCTSQQFTGLDEQIVDG